ncbi:COG3650 family protein [Paracoccus saliphilus]|uniref:SH3 domain-containing protein n=1 Tax=Paracoccus saliphilus TaxID=405559 RepID=A0AA45W110_9RHOB|nr:SH3 domain-containing protein [Paracoccus saliphilus]WCR03419.1 SH3 domain-containing protein [Paracoccus saliphilus]SIS53250.1 SH3 domain-containing protein [Paracoccus saliphilus]
MLRTAILLMMLAGPASATQEYILPTLFDVTGVAADDVLNIRAQPNAGAEIVGMLAPDSTKIEVVEETKGWGRVNSGEASGWVSMAYLAYRIDVWEDGELPDGFRCYGTEPFWGLERQGDQLLLSRPDSEDDARPIQTVLGTGVFRDPMRAVVAEGMTVTSTRAICSDGMSDRLFGLEAHVILHGDKPAMLSGCCSIQP